MRMLSIIASNMLGSVAGLTFMTNPFHQIVVRKRTVPVQPNTNGQVNAKLAFASGVWAWEQLSDIERQAWDAYAETVKFSGPLGQYSPTGRMLAIAQYQISGYLVNQLGLVFPGGLSMNPPTKPGLLVIGTPVIMDLAAPGIGFRIQITNINDEAIKVYASISFQQSQSRYFYKGPFNISTLLGGDIAAETSGFIEWTGLEDDGIYFVKIRIISDLVKRRYSQEMILRVVARETAI